MAHVLGFNPDSFPFFKGENGKPREKVRARETVVPTTWNEMSHNALNRLGMDCSVGSSVLKDRICRCLDAVTIV